LIDYFFYQLNDELIFQLNEN